MIERLSPTARNTALLVLIVLFGWFCWTVRSVLNPLILGYLLAFIVHPLVLRLERRGWRRRSAVNSIFFLFAAGCVLITFGVYLQGRGLAEELMRKDGVRLKVAEKLERASTDYQREIGWILELLPADWQPRATREAPPTDAGRPPQGEGKASTGAPQTPPSGVLDAPGTVSPATKPTNAPVDGRLEPEPSVLAGKSPPDPAGTGATADTSTEPAVQASNQAAGSAPRNPGAHPSVDLSKLFRDWWDTLLTGEHGTEARAIGMQAAGGLMAWAQSVFGSVLAFLALIVLLPIYTYFLLFELERIHGFCKRYLPRNDRERLIRIATQIGDVLANFFRGRLLVCLAKGAFLAFGLWIAGVEFALLIGLGTGFLSLVPLVGSLVGFVMALVVALLEHSVGGALLRVGLVFGAAEMLENYVLLPKILGDSLGLHPVVVIFSIMAGGAALGMFGLLLALPLAATIVILVREFLLPVLAQLADRDATREPG